MHLPARPVLLWALVLAGLTLRAAQGATEIGVPPAPVIPAGRFEITDYGAVGDGKTMNTAAIGRAIDACQKAGGGSVIVPAGVFLTGPFTLVSHMALVIEKGAAIQGSTRFKDYGLPDPLPTIQDQLDSLRPLLHCLISGSNLTDVAISGQGSIDGAGLPWWQRSGRAYYNPTNAPQLPRPNLIVLTRCNRVAITGVTLLNSPMFHLVPKLCSNVLIDGIKILAPPLAPNTDAIDPSNCNTVLIRHVTTDTGDDNVAFKAGHDGPTQNITVTDCAFKHGHGVSIGSETDGGIRNILVQRCSFADSDNAIRIKSSRSKGGIVEDVTYRDITMQSVGKAIVVDLFYDDKAGAEAMDKKSVTAKTPMVRNILLSNINCADAMSAGQIVGLPEASATNITLENVKISARIGFTIQDTRGLEFHNVSIVTAARSPTLIQSPAASSSPVVLAKGRKVTVAANGSGDFKTIQDAVNAAPEALAGGEAYVVHIKPGAYREVVNVPAAKGAIKFEGDNAATTTITYDNAASTLDENGNQLGTFRSATVFIGANDFSAENITFQNKSAARVQALAVNISGDRQTFRNCRFLGWQDTVFLRQGCQYFENCDILGAADFIFGGSAAYFERCRIDCVSHGYITAACTPEFQPYGFVFDRCVISGSVGVKTYLGRPWRPHASVVFLDTIMSDVVEPAGWSVWDKTNNHLTARYSEWNNSGPGANPASRVAWSSQLTAEQARALTVPAVLDGWTPVGTMAPP